MVTLSPKHKNISVLLARLQRKPQRITITLPAGACEQLLRRAKVEGRSMSNLAAYLIESALGNWEVW